MPGRTPRHPDGAFDAIRDRVPAALTPAALAGCDAWAAGWQYLRDGYFWEAHELWEPVWMALPAGSPARGLVQAMIQIANAGLKLRMGRPRAVRRLCAMAEDLLAGGGWRAAAACGASGTEIRAILLRFRAAANLPGSGLRNVQYNAETGEGAGQ